MKLNIFRGDVTNALARIKTIVLHVPNNWKTFKNKLHQVFEARSSMTAC